jgi:hypothetical protein
VVSDWHTGRHLHPWLEERCRQDDRRAIANLAERWTRIMLAWHDAGVAHGDLLCGNILVRDNGEFVLVDYDTMCVPGLEGRKNLELGVLPYQHPQRDENTRLSRDLDNFSALLILVAIKALSLQPGLWQKHVAGTGYEKLLFRQEDLEQPEQSSLHGDLMQLPDPTLRRLVHTLFRAWRGNLSDVPSLREAVDDAQRGDDSPPAQMRRMEATQASAATPAANPAENAPAACPVCRSSEIRYRPRLVDWICDACDHRWKPVALNVAFISYRRDGGSETARLIKSELRQRGLQAFLDVDDLRSHHFDERLLREIEKCPNFIIILSPGCLDRCSQEGDWLRREISHAIGQGRNLVPVLKDGFTFPPRAALPAEMADLPRYNCVEYSHAYFSSTIDRLVGFLNAAEA